jgi:hypothetical protein
MVANHCIVNPIGVYNRPSNCAQEAMETAILEMQSEVQEYIKRRNCKKL